MAKQKKVAIFGGSGFVGSNILEELSNNSFIINTLLRQGSEKKLPKVNNVNIYNGDLSNIESVKKTINNSDIVIYAVGIIRENRERGITFDKLHYEYFRNIVDLAKSSGVKRIIYISANGVSERGTVYQTTKYKAEQYLQNNFDNWLIFRPSVVFGNSKGKMEFMSQLANDIIKKPIPAPLFFVNNPFNINDFFKSNPIHIQNLTKIIVQSIKDDTIVNKKIDLGGPNVVNWRTILKTISIVLNKKKIFIPVPIVFISIVAKLLDRFQFFPITKTQIEMLKEGNTCNSEEIFKQLNIQPISFTTDSINYLK